MKGDEGEIGMRRMVFVLPVRRPPFCTSLWMDDGERRWIWNELRVASCEEVDGGEK